VVALNRAAELMASAPLSVNLRYLQVGFKVSFDCGGFQNESLILFRKWTTSLGTTTRQLYFLCPWKLSGNSSKLLRRLRKSDVYRKYKRLKDILFILIWSLVCYSIQCITVLGILCRGVDLTFI
jgi:hypothetical protein